MTKQHFYASKYGNSWALIIGINDYLRASPLQFARKDAEAVARILIDNFDFPAENIVTLLDKEATKTRIIESFLEFAQDRIEPDDRIFFYFAGHGFTYSGRRGEVGFLIPVDGDTNNLASLIRWDELTRNTELIVAKHMLFIMDACYGGLALTRTIPSGSMRFLKNMLQRYVRQVLTAGKADEPVLDLGGPLPGHSMFTGHLLQALQGEAASSDGIITANGIMSYVYEKVSKDSRSRQTPHFGFLDGDGDFIFQAELLNTLPDDSETNQDILVEITFPSDATNPLTPNLNLANTVKEYISDNRYRIKLDDLVIQQVRIIKSLTSDAQFPVQTANVTVEEFIDRLKRYEAITSDLQIIVALLSHWGDSVHLATLKKIIERMSEWPEHQSGKVMWLNLRWYPTLLLLYSGGIAAIAAENYDNLYTLLTTKSGSVSTYTESQEVILRANDATRQADFFKQLPGHERNYVPQSEYLFKLLQPLLDDLLYLGTSYEEVFDHFEIFQALFYADSRYENHRSVRGPLGRFAWKHQSHKRESGPFTQLLSEAKTLQDNWPPLKSGLFGGSYSRFKSIALQYEEFIMKLNWI